MSKLIFPFIASLILLSSCNSSKEVQYFQDTIANQEEYAIPNTGITIEPNDLLSIIVTTKDPELSAIFNMQPGSTGTSSGSNNNETAKKVDYGYRVDNYGDIGFPALGTLHVAGMTRSELENLIRQRIIKEGLLKEFSVSVSFLNFKISVIGDVKSPGIINIKDDKFTILQALAECGDLNITGDRSNVTVIREKNGKRTFYKLDLRSKAMFDSPAYYMQQNDVVYVVPNEKKSGERDINTNTWKQVGTWTGLISIAASLTTLIVTLTD